MTASQPSLRDEIAHLILRRQEGTISEAETSQLIAWLEQGAAHRKIYVEFVALQATLEWDLGAVPDRSTADVAAMLDAALDKVGDAALSPADERLAAQESHATAAAEPVNEPLPPVRPAPISVLGWLTDAVPARVLMLCVAASLGIYFTSLVVSLVREQIERSVTHPAHLAEPPAHAPAGYVLEDRGGRFKSTRDQAVGAAIDNRTLELEAGAMVYELAGGTRLTVQAPARYRVEARDRVVLEFGQLLARVTPAAVGFTVLTPNVAVVDLGTEFGVEVAAPEETRVTVLKGRVELRALADRDANPATVEARAGETVQITAGGRVTTAPAAEAARLARRFSTLSTVDPERTQGSTTLRLLAHYPLGEDDPAGPEPGGKTYPAADSPVGNALEIVGTGKYTGDVAAPGSRRAMVFGPQAARGVHGAGLASPLVDNWVVEAWVRAPLGSDVMLVHAGTHREQSGFGLCLNGDEWVGNFSYVAFLDFGAKVQLDRWTHLALVRERGQTNLYVDGRLAGSARFSTPHEATPELEIGASEFQGELDEVRVWELRGAFRPELLAK